MLPHNVPRRTVLPCPDERSAVRLLLEHVRCGSATQVLVSGAFGERAYMIGAAEIWSALGAGWDISAIPSRTAEGYRLFLRQFADAIGQDPAQRRIRFCPVWLPQLQMLLGSIRVGCDMAVYIMGFDTQMRIREEIQGVNSQLAQWRRRLGGTTRIESIVSADENIILLKTQRRLREALERGESPVELLEAVLELRDG